MPENCGSLEYLHAAVVTWTVHSQNPLWIVRLAGFS